MAEIQFGQIPFNLICRFDELSKTEIRVISYLYACRNTETLQCNPSRKLITTDTGINKTHLSPAIKSLEDKQWIIEDEKGHFILNENPIKKVTDSVTIKPKVTKTVTKVTESVTKSYENGNSHIKDLNRERTEKEQRKGLSDKSDRPRTGQKVSDLTEKQKQDFNEAMKFLATKGKFPNYAAQGKALKWMLKEGADALQIQKGLERQIAEYQGRFTASYLTLQKDIFRWIQEGNGQILEAYQKNGATNGTHQANGRSGFGESPAQKRERESIERQQLRQFNRERREREAAEQGIVSA